MRGRKFRITKTAYGSFTWIGALLILLSACRGGEESSVVASYKDTDLHLRQLEQYIPKDASEDDSTRYAKLYIDQWLKAQAIGDLAMQTIPNLQDEIEFKVEDYRQKLIMHEYSSRLIRDSLDTTIRSNDVLEYYKANTATFISPVRMYSYFYVVCRAENTGDVVEALSGTKSEDIRNLLDWAKVNALEYKLDSTYAPESVINEITKGYFGELRDAGVGRVIKWSGMIQGQRRRYYFKMLDKVEENGPLPVLLARDRISNILLNERKVKLIEQSEKNIVDNARRNNYIRY
jgi:hypothetical protein